MLVKVREWTAQDVAGLAAIADSRKVWDNCRDRLPSPYSEADAAAWIGSQEAHRQPMHFCIEADGHVAGTIGLEVKSDIHRFTAELGYFIGDKFWNMGIATNAVKQVMQYVMDELDLIRVYAGVFDFNKPSMRVLEKNGFHLESIAEKAVMKNNILRDEYIWVRIITR